jgi:hypothetical protein
VDDLLEIVSFWRISYLFVIVCTYFESLREIEEGEKEFYPSQAVSSSKYGHVA